MDRITAITVIIVGIIAAVSDWKTGRIPNLLTFPAMFLGIGYTLWNQGAVNGMNRCLVLILLSFVGMTALFGMGDLKLIMAFFALGGGRFMLMTVVIATALVLVVQFIKHKDETLLDIKAGIWNLFTLRLDRTIGTGRKVKFAPYLLCGAIGGVAVCGLI